MRNFGQMKNQLPQMPALQEPHGRIITQTLQHFEEVADIADEAREQPVIGDIPAGTKYIMQSRRFPAGSPSGRRLAAQQRRMWWKKAKGTQP